MTGELTVRIYAVDPEWFRGTVEDVWKLEEQVGSFCDPLSFEGLEAYQISSACRELGELAARHAGEWADAIDDLQAGDLEAFRGLVSGESIAAEVFDCGAPPMPHEFREVDVLCIAPEDLPTVVRASAVLMQEPNRDVWSGTIPNHVETSSVRQVLAVLADLEADGDCLVGWDIAEP